MKFLIVIVILGLAAANTEDCVRTKCKDEVNNCTFNIGCALAASNCDTKCKKNGVSDSACNVECAKSKNNAILNKLNQCGIDNCSGVQLPALSSVSACANDLYNACTLETSVKSMICVAKFFYGRPDCTQ